MSRTTRLYLNDILKAADKIARFVESLDAEMFKPTNYTRMASYTIS